MNPAKTTIRHDENEIARSMFADDNLDTGKVAHPGEYEPADEARAALEKKLASLNKDKDATQHALAR
jgi:hypothetical protein